MEVTHQDAPEVNTFQQNRAGLLDKQPDGSFVGRTVAEIGVEHEVHTAVVRGKTLTLREAYDRYKANKGIGRADMIGLLLEAVEELQARIGAVDEAAVKALDHRVASLETVLGRAMMAMEGQMMPRHPDWLMVEDYDRVISIFGVRYTRELFEDMAFFEVGSTFRIEARDDGVVTLSRLEGEESPQKKRGPGRPRAVKTEAGNG